MTSTTVTPHATQPLNFGPEWLRALSTPDSATSVPSSSGSAGGNVFKFSATKYRYSKDEILALRANVSERLNEAVKTEILENLKDIESVFRPNIVEPLSLTTPSSEEAVKLNALSSYMSGRTPGGAGRAGHVSQQSQQDSRSIRGHSSVSNGRGSTRSRGGRDPAFGPSRPNNNNNSDDNGENGNAGDEAPASTSSSWSRGNSQSRGGSFVHRLRSYEERDQPQGFRRSGGTRHPSEGWRRSKGDDEDNKNNSNTEDSSTPTNSSSSWASKGGPGRRGGGNATLDQRTKSNEKWNSNEDRSGSSSSHDSYQHRGGGWRTNSSVSDRDLNIRSSQSKRDSMPEWMDDNNDDDHLGNATFEQDGTFTRSKPVRQNENNEQTHSTESQSTSDETSPSGNADSSAQKDEAKPEKVTVTVDNTVANAPVTSEPIVSQQIAPVRQYLPLLDDDFDHIDVATNVVELTLADDHDYSPPISTHSTSRQISLEPSAAAAPIVQQQRAPVIADDKQWFYKDPQNTVQGPFSSADMERWFAAGYFTILLPVKRVGDAQFSTIQQLTQDLGRLPFRTDVPSVTPTPVQKQQTMMPESQKFNRMTFTSSSTANNAYMDDYVVPQPRQNIQHPMLFNRQTSMPVSTNDPKSISSSSSNMSQLQGYFNTQSQSSLSPSSLFSSNMTSDPAVLYQQQLQRSLSSTNQQQQQQSSSSLYDEMQRSMRQLSSQSASSSNLSFLPSNVLMPQQQSNDILTRLSQALQTHGKQQQDKVEEHRRLEQQRQEVEFERLMLLHQDEQMRLQREEDERRRFEQELRKKHESFAHRSISFDHLAKAMDHKKQPAMDIDQYLSLQQSIQYQKEQAQIEAQQAENVRRYQEKYREQPQQPTFKLTDPNTWARHSSQTNDLPQSFNFAGIQQQEHERRAREAAAFAHQYEKSQPFPVQNSTSSSSINKTGSWAQTLFASSNSGNSNVPSASSHRMCEPDINENTLTDASLAAYNQQATNAPKSRSTTNQQSVTWNGSSNVTNASVQDIQRMQQAQNEAIQQPTHQISSGHSSTATVAWNNNVQNPIPSQQSSSSSSAFMWNNQQAPPSNKLSTKTSNVSSSPWNEIKATPSTVTSSSSTAAAASRKLNIANDEATKSAAESSSSSSAMRVQHALSMWTQIQFKDTFKDIDVPTLVQLLKDIDKAGEIAEYVQPYIETVSKAKEFANNFLVKRNQLINAKHDLDDECFNELIMAPTSLNDNSFSGSDEGFQLASSNMQKKRTKKLKGQKVDVK